MIAALAYALPFDDDEEEQTEFTFDQLDDRAKEKARAWFRHDYPDHDWWDSVYDDVAAIADMFGIDLDTRPVRLMGGGTRHEPAIHFSGFWSQGDGACIEGRWEPHKCPMLILDKVLEHAPQDEKLHEIAFAFALLSERHGPNHDEDGHTHVRLTHTGRYYHEHSVSIHFDSEPPYGSEDWNEFQTMTWEAIQRSRCMDTWQDDVTETFRDFMRWIYRQLESEYEYLTSDEVVDEILVENGYVFDEDGAIV